MNKTIAIYILCVGLVSVSFVSVKLNSANNTLSFDLEKTTQDLSDTKLMLEDNTSELNSLKTTFKNTTDKLQQTQDQLTATESVLHSTRVELTATKSDLESETSIQNQMVTDYQVLRDSVNGRFLLTSSDKQQMVYDSSIVHNQVRDIAGEYSEESNTRWDDCGRMYQWIIDNISYSSDSPVPVLPDTIVGDIYWRSEYWRTPEETLEAGTGDCEDMALLLANMLKSYCKDRFATWCIGIRSDVTSKGHLAVVVPAGDGQIMILDPAGNYCTTNSDGSFSSADFASELNNWLTYWDDELPDAYVKTVFSDYFYEGFNDTSEFTEWFYSDV